MMVVDISSENCQITKLFWPHNGSLISWKSKKLTTVALSTCEVKYIALCSVMQDANFLKQFYQDRKGDKVERNIYADNQSAIELTKNPIHH